MVTTDGFDDPRDLSLKTSLSGDLRRGDHTGEMLFGIYEQASYARSALTLDAGDVPAEGTSSGIARHRSGEDMKAGDTVRRGIDEIGHPGGPIVVEPQAG